MLLTLLMVANSYASELIPGLQNGSYQLKRGNPVVCTFAIIPKVGNVDDKVILQLDKRTGFVWEQVNKMDKEGLDGCAYGAIQEIVTNGDSSILTLTNIEECRNPKLSLGSERSVLKLNKGEIELSVDTVHKNKHGIWEVDRRKEGYSCSWSIKQSIK